MGEFQVVVGTVVPRQFGDPFQIRSDDLRVHRLAAGTLELRQFAIDLGAGFLGKLELGESVAEVFHLAALVAFAEFILNRPQLLAEVHFALAFAEFFLNLGLDLRLGLQHAELALNVDEDAAHPFLDGERFEQFLLLGNGQLDVTGDEVGERPRLGDVVHHVVQDFLRQASGLAEFHRPFASLASERRESAVLLVDGLDLVDGGDFGGEVVVRRLIAQSLASGFTLEEKLHPSQAALKLADAGDHAHRIKIFTGRLVGVFTLGDGEDKAVGLHRGVDRPQGRRPSGGDRHGDSGKHHSPPKRQDRQILSVRHDLLSFPGRVENSDRP